MKVCKCFTKNKITKEEKQLRKKSVGMLKQIIIKTSNEDSGEMEIRIASELVSKGLIDEHKKYTNFDWNIIHFCAYYSNHLLLKFFLTKFVSSKTLLLNEEDLNGNTPLHLAAATGKLKVIKLLLDAGSNREALNKLGKTPREMSEMTQNESFTDALILLNHDDKDFFMHINGTNKVPTEG